MNNIKANKTTIQKQYKTTQQHNTTQHNTTHNNTNKDVWCHACE